MKAQRWVVPIVWTFVSLSVLTGAALYMIQWNRYIKDPDDSEIELRRTMYEKLEIKSSAKSLSPAETEHVLAHASADAGEPVEELDAIYGPHVPGYMTQLLLVFYVPFFLIGVGGTLTHLVGGPSPHAHVLWSEPRKWQRAARRISNNVRAFFNRSLPPHRFLLSWINGITLGELVIYIYFLLLNVLYFVYFVEVYGLESWDDGEVDQVHSLTTFSKEQWILERVALCLGVLFLLQAPFLLIPACRGSLINTFFGVKYGTMVKWHRWFGVMVMVDIILHGILYQALWISDSGSMWAEELFRFKYKHYASNLAGLIAWLAAIVMTVFLLPVVRRRMYSVRPVGSFTLPSLWGTVHFYSNVSGTLDFDTMHPCSVLVGHCMQLFYYSHVVGSVLFFIFGTIHLTAVYMYAAPSLAIYGIDVAYRLVMTSRKVQVGVNKSGTIVTMALPYEGPEPYEDECHVWICFPEIGYIQYHPFSVASSVADPAWKNSLLIQCKVYNKWTKKLADKVASLPAGATMTARIQGPYDGKTMSATEMQTYESVTVLSGGVGITAVLPMLIRFGEVMDGKGPRITLVHACRTVDEMMLVAPLLEYADRMSLVLHFTGKDKSALVTTTVNLPAPHVARISTGPGGKLSPTPSGDAAEKRVSFEHERGASSGLSPAGNGNKSAVMRLPSPWEMLFVWAIAVAIGSVALLAPTFWWNSNNSAQLYILPEDELATRLMQEAWLCVTFMVVMVPVAPLLAILIWRLASHFIGGHGRRNVESSADLDTKTAGEQACVSLVAEDGQAKMMSMKPAAVPVPVHVGRPDLPGMVNKQFEALSGSGVMGVWVSGSKTMNHTAMVATAKLGHPTRVRLFPMAFEL